jgi:hypothetical protein
LDEQQGLPRHGESTGLGQLGHPKVDRESTTRFYIYIYVGAQEGPTDEMGMIRMTMQLPGFGIPFEEQGTSDFDLQVGISYFF